MQNFYELQQLLKKFGTIIYVGDRLGDLELMEMEIRELYQAKIIEPVVFQQAILLLRKEMEKERKNHESND
ncbi:MAG TPA: YqgQ family protein [Massilibacterium sp.]|nr:YqgQ family protein [Massilibacterium sp.]